MKQCRYDSFEEKQFQPQGIQRIQKIKEQKAKQMQNILVADTAQQRKKQNLRFSLNQTNDYYKRSLEQRLEKLFHKQKYFSKGRYHENQQINLQLIDEQKIQTLNEIKKKTTNRSFSKPQLLSSIDQMEVKLLFLEQKYSNERKKQSNQIQAISESMEEKNCLKKMSIKENISYLNVKQVLFNSLNTEIQNLKKLNQQSINQKYFQVQKQIINLNVKIEELAKKFQKRQQKKRIKKDQIRFILMQLLQKINKIKIERQKKQKETKISNSCEQKQFNISNAKNIAKKTLTDIN